jgi:glycosyltransferase involved in cell wall biosynthesis
VQGRLRSVGLVGTYPPTRCGIATFTASLAKATAAAQPDCRLGVVACVDEQAPALHSSEVVAQLVSGSAASRAAAVAALGEFEVLILQHEFGVYGGEDGCEVVDLVRDLGRPLIVVLHTVLRRPTLGQRRIIEQLAVLADRLVVQSAAARVRLLEQYVVDPEKTRTIPHGARSNLSAEPRGRDDSRSPVVLTWGLLGPDKGIEWGIEAIAHLRELEPAPRYVVVGQTHPHVREIHGEEYRDALRALAADLGVADLVEFDDAYNDTSSLLARVREADVVLLPYRSREQVVSGVLVEALASGKPVVATRFPHAVELLGEGSGLLVPHEDAEAIAEALRRLLTDTALASRAAAVARHQARSLFWETVGESYLALAAEIVRRQAPTRLTSFPPPSLERLLRLSDGVPGAWVRHR